jgi:alpha-amylase
MADFIKTTRSESGKPNLFAVGEFWKDSVDDLERYIEGLGTQVCHLISCPFSLLLDNADSVIIFKNNKFSVMDVPLHYNFKEAGDRGPNFDMRSIWDGTLVQRQPIHAVTFVDNHEHVSNSSTLV